MLHLNVTEILLIKHCFWICGRKTMSLVFLTNVIVLNEQQWPQQVQGGNVPNYI